VEGSGYREEGREHGPEQWTSLQRFTKSAIDQMTDASFVSRQTAVAKSSTGVINGGTNVFIRELCEERSSFQVCIQILQMVLMVVVLWWFLGLRRWRRAERKAGGLRR
jgi:hypothetical protein